LDATATQTLVTLTAVLVAVYLVNWLLGVLHT